jgi:uncharacterized membrane protein
MELILLILMFVILIGMAIQLSSHSKAMDQIVEELKTIRKQRETPPAQDHPKAPESTGVQPKAEPIRIEIRKEIKLDIQRETVPPPAVRLEGPIFEEPGPQPVRTPAEGPRDPAHGKSWWDRWLAENPDIEKFIGENLINKIGIAVLVLGIAFFVKYAIDQDWINEGSRVCVGLFCGLVLLGLAHRLRRSYHSFSSVLVGGGLTVFYFTIAFAFHQYHLISQDSAFIIMCTITALAVILSVGYDRIELAILASLGGFVTPMLVSTGEGNYRVLFTYLAILNAGLIVLSYYKKWRVLNFISFVFTEGIYLTWIIGKSDDLNFPYLNIFWFGMVFYLLFVLMNAIHHVIRASRLNAFDFLMMFSVNFVFYASGIYLLVEGGMGDYKGLFTGALGIINLLLSWIFYRQSRADINFIHLLIGITLTFTSLAVPVQLKGNDITLFWAAEMVVLLGLYQRTRISLLKSSSAILGILVITSLVMDWYAFYVRSHQPFRVFLNTGSITGSLVALSCLLNYLLLGRQKETLYLRGIPMAQARGVFLCGSALILLVTGALEIFFQFHYRLAERGIAPIFLESYLFAFFILLFYLLRKNKIRMEDFLRLGLPLVLFFYYLIHTAGNYETEQLLLRTGQDRPYFMANWVSDCLLLILCLGTIPFARRGDPEPKRWLPGFSWICTLAILVVISIEFRNAYVWISYSDPSSILHAESLYDKAGLTIIWGISSFVIIWIGMSKGFRPLRIFALIIFAISLLKLFILDIRHIQPAGKIIAFILLGMLLLMVSFMYQRLKRLIVEDIRPS